MTSHSEYRIASGKTHLPPGTTFYLLLSVVMFFLASSSVPTPLYSIYRTQWSFSPSTMTIVFGVYAIAVLASLLTVGSISDYVGRRPVLLISVFAMACVMIIFAFAGNVIVLIVARILQGLTTGASLGALGAALVDVNKEKGTVANAAAPPFGTAAGSLGASVVIQYLPYPTHLVYMLLFVAFIIQGVALSFMAESSTPKAGALNSLKFKLGLPKSVRLPLLIGTPVLVAIWSLAGFYLSLGPELVARISRSHSIILGGLTPFILAGVGSFAVLIIQTLKPQRVTFLGASALIVGLGITLLSLTTNSTAEFFIGTAVAGIGFGAGFQGVLRTVIPQANPEDRASVISIIFIISYLSMGIPSIVSGFIVVHHGLLFTTHIYGWTILALAFLALLALARRATRS